MLIITDNQTDSFHFLKQHVFQFLRKVHIRYHLDAFYSYYVIKKLFVKNIKFSKKFCKYKV